MAWAVAMALSIATGVLVQKLWMFRAEVESLAARLSIDTGPE